MTFGKISFQSFEPIWCVAPDHGKKLDLSFRRGDVIGFVVPVIEPADARRESLEIFCAEFVRTNATFFALHGSIAGDDFEIIGVQNDFAGLDLNAVSAIAKPLFSDNLLAFELTSILLLVAIVGAVVLGKRRASA